MKTSIIKTPKKSSGRGAFGTYYQISSKVGIKVINLSYVRSSLATYYKDFLDWLEVSDDNFPLITEAARELAALQILEPSRVTPKPMGLCWVDCENGRYKIGILMEHIDGKTLEKWCEKNNKNCKYLCDKMKRKYHRLWVRKFGIWLYDWHDENIMVRSDGTKVRIDISADYFKLSNDRWKEFIDRVQYETIKLMEICPLKF